MNHDGIMYLKFSLLEIWSYNFLYSFNNAETIVLFQFDSIPHNSCLEIQNLLQPADPEISRERGS